MDKYKELVNLAELLATVANETSIIVDARIRQALDSKIGDIKQHLSNYLSYMQSASIMITASANMWVSRKQLPSGKHKHIVKFKDMCNKFGESAKALIKPLTYFAQIPSGGSGTPETGKIKSLNDISSLIEQMLQKFDDSVKVLLPKLLEKSNKSDDKNGGCYDTVRSKLVTGGVEQGMVATSVIKLGGEEGQVWIGGFQVSDLLSRQIAKIEIMKNTMKKNGDIPESVLRHEIAGLLGESDDGQVDEIINDIIDNGITINTVAKMSDMDKGIRSIKWVGEVVPAYIDEHRKKNSKWIEMDDDASVHGASSDDTLTEHLLKTYLDESCEWYDQLFGMDRKILIGMGIDEFQSIKGIKNRKQFDDSVKELQSQIKNITEVDRSSTMSEINYINDELRSVCESIQTLIAGSLPLRLEINDGNKVGHDATQTIQFFEQLIAAELKVKQQVIDLESLYNSGAQLLSTLADHWRRLISPQVLSTCIKRVGAIIRALVRLDILRVIAKNKFADAAAELAKMKVTENHPAISSNGDVLYDKALKLSVLERAVDSIM